MAVERAERRASFSGLGGIGGAEIGVFEVVGRLRSKGESESRRSGSLAFAWVWGCGGFGID